MGLLYPWDSPGKNTGVGCHFLLQGSLGISDFLEEISSLSHSIVFLYFFALIAEEGFLISPCYSFLCMRWPKYWSFSFSIIPSKEHPGLISSLPHSVVFLYFFALITEEGFLISPFYSLGF